MKNLLSKLSKIEFFLLFVLMLTLVLLTNHLWHGDVILHTDAARDFLVLQEMVSTRSPTLIGPRSGGVPGVFHGPLWYYVNIVPFILAQGNPVLMGWFWWFLGVSADVLFLLVCFAYTKKKSLSILAAIGFAVMLLPAAAGPVNNYIAELLSFLLVVFWLRWYQKPTLLNSSVAWFFMGVLVQFQMAFIVPIVMLWLPFFVWKCLKDKNFFHLLSISAFLTTLALFLLFELRHDWLQLRSVLIYLKSADREVRPVLALVKERLGVMVFDGLNIFGVTRWLATVVLSIFLYIGYKSKELHAKFLVLMSMYWYFGWWVVTLAFNGTIWTYYFTPFIGIFLLVITLIAKRSHFAKFFLAFLVVCSVWQNRNTMMYNTSKFDRSSWKLLSQIAQESLSQPHRGYFLYGQDQFAYSLKYAFLFYQQQHPQAMSSYFKKQKDTILVKEKDNPANPYSTAEDWQKNKVRIASEPVEVKIYPHGYTMERYVLDEESVKIPTDQYMITDLHFR